jgi:hypothetical protein
MRPARPRRNEKRSFANRRLNFARAAEESKPIRGMKLKTVSALTLMFALLSLAAFIAGKTPAPPRSARPAPSMGRSSSIDHATRGRATWTAAAVHD